MPLDLHCLEYRLQPPHPSRRRALRLVPAAPSPSTQEPEMSLDLEALETSFDLLAPRGDELMDEFYARLFEAAPSVRPLFPDDMKKQKTMLLGALVLLRKSLRDLDAIAPKLRELGARHVAYGAAPELFLPLRMEEGYGLSHESVERCWQLLQPQLLIAVDCGSGCGLQAARP